VRPAQQAVTSLQTGVLERLAVAAVDLASHPGFDLERGNRWFGAARSAATWVGSGMLVDQSGAAANSPFYTLSNFQLFFDCYTGLNSLIVRKIQLIRQVTNLICKYLEYCYLFRSCPRRYSQKTRFSLYLGSKEPPNGAVRGAWRREHVRRRGCSQDTRQSAMMMRQLAKLLARPRSGTR